MKWESLLLLFAELLSLFSISTIFIRKTRLIQIVFFSTLGYMWWTGDAVNPIQCKFTITHKEKRMAGFRMELVTEDNDTNVNYELLDGTGLQSDTTIESAYSPVILELIRFYPWGFPCIRSVSILCGNQLFQSSLANTYTFIEFQDMINAWIRQGKKRDIDIDDIEPQCVNFNRDGHNNGFKAMHVHANIFKCGKSDNVIFNLVKRITHSVREKNN